MKPLLKLIFLFYIISSLNAKPSLTWEHVYDNQGTVWDGINSVCASDSENFFLVGFTLIPTPFNHYKIWVIKINSNGDTLWRETIGRDGSTGFSVVESGDGGCVISGRAGEAFAIKLSKGRQILWERYYGGSGVQINKIVKTSDGGYVACGTINLQHGYIFKIDSLGYFQWDKIIPSDYLNGIF